MAKLYFAKANLNEHIYEAYQDVSILETYKQKMYSNIKDDLTVELEEEFYHENSLGETVQEIRKVSYGFLNIKKDDISRTLVGTVIKYSKRNRTEVIDKTVVNIRDKNDIPISFYFDVNKEIVLYSTKTNFGHVDFLKAFESIINEAINESEFTFRFELIKNTNSVIERISKFKKVLEIKTEFIPPNPNEEEFTDLFGRQSNDFKEANIKKVTTIVEGGKDGIETNALEVKKAIYTSALGYGNVEVKGIDNDDVLDNFSDKVGMPLTIDYPSVKAKSLIDLQEDGDTFVRKITNIRNVAKEDIKAFINLFYSNK